MACYHPLTAYRAINGINPENGKWKITFNKKEAHGYLPVLLPCGKCIGCRLEHSRQWAIRCVHEASLYAENCFITLTYDNEHLDKNGSLNKRDFPLFMKRLRKEFGDGIRFYHSGEYGERFQRPHHHACLFNLDFPDKVYWKNAGGNTLYTSATLQKLWGKGYTVTADVSFQSAAYVARYITKKITGKRADEHYHGRVPEHVSMSRRPGLARGWIENNAPDVYPSDYIVIRDSIKCKPPRYYDNIYDIVDHDQMEQIKQNRRDKAKKLAVENTPERLEIKEQVIQQRFKKLKRSFEHYDDEHLCDT